MIKTEKQIVVTRIDPSYKLYFTAQQRKIFLLFRGMWKDIKPAMVESYSEAERIMNDDFCKCTYIQNHQKDPDICVWCGCYFNHY